MKNYSHHYSISLACKISSFMIHMHFDLDVCTYIHSFNTYFLLDVFGHKNIMTFLVAALGRWWFFLIHLDFWQMCLLHTGRASLTVYLLFLCFNVPYNGDRSLNWLFCQISRRKKGKWFTSVRRRVSSRFYLMNVIGGTLSTSLMCACVCVCASQMCSSKTIYHDYVKLIVHSSILLLITCHPSPIPPHLTHHPFSVPVVDHLQLHP